MANYNTQTRVVHFDNASRTVRNVAPTIYETDGKVAPFLYLVKQAKQETDNPKYEFFSRTSAVRQTSVNNHPGPYDQNATSIVVTDGTVFRIDDVLYNPTTFEKMLITNIVGNTLTVTRHLSAYGAGTETIADHEVLYAIGSASPEGSDRIGVVSVQPTSYYNYTQIFKTTVQISGTAMNTNVYGPDELRDDRDRKWRQHQMEMEAAFLTGARRIATSGDDVTRFTGGFIDFLIGAGGSNVWNVSGAITKATLDAYLATYIFPYGNENHVRVALCNMKFLQYLNALLNSYLNKDLVKGDNFFGINFRDYENYAGTVRCLEHRLLSKMYTAQAVCALVDPDYVRYRYMRGRDTRWREAGIDTDLLDGYVGEYITEAGLEMTGIECHGWIYGATGTE